MRVVIDPGYERAVAAALDLLIDQDALLAAERLLERALRFLPALLMQFPHAGRDFIARNPASDKVSMAVEHLHALLGDDIELREYLLDDYLALYAIRHETVTLLTLRHHRQSGFALVT